MSKCCAFEVEFICNDSIEISFLSENYFDLDMGETVGEYQPYTGGYEFTPSQEEQVIQTKSRVLLENITINPIPSNYGLITWNGSVITVS